MGSLDERTNEEAQSRFDALAKEYLALVPGADIASVLYIAISSNNLANLTGSGADGAMRCSIGTREKALALALAAKQAELG